MVPTEEAMMTRQMPYSAGAPSRAIVPLAMLFPPKLPYCKMASLAIQDAGRQNPPRRTPRKKLPQAAILGNLGENRAGSQQTGQESPRSYIQPRAKSRDGFIRW